MEVSGKKASKDENIEHCSFCEDYDITTYADGFCLECEVYICDACFVKHKGRRVNRNHSLVNVEDSDSIKRKVDNTYDTCQYHIGELVKFYCSKHGQVCCGDCSVSNHNGCKMEFISNKAVTFENSQDCKNLREGLNKCKTQAEYSVSLIATNRQQLSDFYEKFVRDVETFAKEVIERIKSTKKTILNQGKDVMLNDKRKMDDIQKETVDFIAEISHQISLLDSKNDQPNKLFVTSLLVKPELKRAQHNISIIRKKNTVTKYTFKRDQTLEEIIKESKWIGLLLEQQETSTCNLVQCEFKQTSSAGEAKVKDLSSQEFGKAEKYGKSIEDLTSNTLKCDDDDFHTIETIKDVQENVWDILCCSDQFRQIKDKCKYISYDNQTYTVSIGQEVRKDDFLKITANVDDLRGKEWDEIPLKKQHCNKSTVDRWCDEVKEVIGYECCKYITGKGKVLVYAVNYDDILKTKHLIGVRTGKIKTTGKAKRGGKETSDKDVRQVDTAGSFGAVSKNPDRKIDGKNFQKYITKENINVFVYEANILKLDVDCIVNAANESLQHGGGVASVIERAAGYKLTEESRTYVRVNGNLPVGKACTTTAGNLSYDCVIHTVSPRWSAYSPLAIQECQLHLYQAVYNSFNEAEKRGLKTIGLPAISSAIFGVPEEICVQQYAKATFDYSRKTSDEPTALKEIHFIDKNSNIVKKIQDAFYLKFVKGEMHDCDTSKFVKSRRHGKGHSPGSYTGAQASFSSSVHKDSFNAQT